MNPNNSWTYYNQTFQNCTTCSVQNCQRCSMYSECDQCMSGFSLLSMNSSQMCLQCPDNCNQCSLLNNQTQCIECQPGYFWNGTLNQCQAISCQQQGVYTLANTNLCEFCPVGCSSCLNYSYCLQCTSNFWFDYMSNTCQIQCTNGTYLDLNSLTCQNCSDGCMSCENYMTCLDCAPGYFKSPQNMAMGMTSFQCLPCQNNCNYCYSDTSSMNMMNLNATITTGNTSLSMNSTLNSTSQMNQTPPFSQNQTVLLPICGFCESGYTYDNTTRTCTFVRCPSLNQYLNLTTNQCEFCIQGCVSCQNNTSCDKCFDNWIYNSTNNTCEMNPSNGTMMANTTNSFNSSMPSIGNSSIGMNMIWQCQDSTEYYDNPNFRCGLCDSGCKFCNQQGCLMCAAGFIQIEVFDPMQLWNTVVCEKAPAMCPMSNQYFSLSQGQCMDCSQGCNMCEGGSQCTQCQDGLFSMQMLNGDVSCINSCPLGFTGIESVNGMECQRCIDGCEVCDQQNCYQCQPNLALLTTPDDMMICVQECPENTFLEEQLGICQRKSTFTYPFQHAILHANLALALRQTTA